MNMVTREYTDFFYCLMFVEILIRHRFEGNCESLKENKRNHIMFVERCEIK